MLSRLCCVSHSIDICTVAIKNIRNMHAASTNQIADIFNFNDKLPYCFYLVLHGDLKWRRFIMQTWHMVDWYNSLLTAWLLTHSSQLTDWLNCSSQLANYQSCSSQLKNCWARISQTHNLLTAFSNHLLIKVAPRPRFGVTLANINR